MYKSIIALFFTILFSVMMVTPSIVTILDFECKIALLIDANEEEEGKEEDDDSIWSLNKQFL